MRLPFFYGWIIVVVTFVTMAIGVNARTAFSLFFPPIIDEFGWERGVTAGAFSFGFLVSGAVSPLIGRLMDRAGPRAVMELGVALMAGGLLLAPLTTQPWHLYLTIGVMVGAGSVRLGYSGQSLFLPNWFIRRRRAFCILREAELEHRRSRLGRHRLDVEARDWHRAVLVDIARLFLRIVHLVRGPGSPDQIPSRHRLQPERSRLGIGYRQSAWYSRPDPAWTRLRSG